MTVGITRGVGGIREEIDKIFDHILFVFPFFSLFFYRTNDGLV